MQATPWFPTLEANQGTLSLLAICLALVLAFWEVMRINRESHAQLRDDVIVASQSLYYAMSHAFDAVLTRDLDKMSSGIREASIIMRVIAQRTQYPRLSIDLVSAAVACDSFLSKLDEPSVERAREFGFLTANLITDLRVSKRFSASHYKEKGPTTLLDLTQRRREEFEKAVATN